jgi:hypothetical protein
MVYPTYGSQVGTTTVLGYQPMQSRVYLAAGALARYCLCLHTHFLLSD